MIYEELYIIEGGERLRIDLSSPSGITLNFRSNLFDDLSKITASHSYTFKLPQTVNNRRVLGSPEDVRGNATAGLRKFRCEFRQNGIDLLGPANIYVNAVSSGSYSAVMTWGVAEGFDELKDDDKPLCELGKATDGIARFYDASAAPAPTDYDNASLWLTPYRGWEVYAASKSVWCVANSSGPVGKCTYPVVPIRAIVERINETYGTRFNLGSRYIGSEQWNADNGEYADNGDSEYISRGVVPLVRAGLTDAQLDKYGLSLESFAISEVQSPDIPVVEGYLFNRTVGTAYQQEKIIKFVRVGSGGDLDWAGSGTYGSISSPANWTFYKKSGGKYVEKMVLDGILTVWYKAPATNDEAEAQADCRLLFNHHTYERDEESANNIKYSVKELANVKGRFVLSYIENQYTSIAETYHMYTFDFRESTGYGPVEIDDANGIAEQYPLFFNIDPMPERIQSGTIHVKPAGRVSDDAAKGYETDVFSNLPDVGCLEFMKSLFYIMGAFPCVGANGDVVPMFYTTLKERHAANDSADWSGKVEGGAGESAESVAFAVGGFSQRNYYLLKNDSIEPETAEPGDDVYEEGKMVVVCESGILGKDKTIVQLPWFGPLLRVGKPKRGGEGSLHDMKYREYDPEDDEWSDCEAEPALGVIFGGAEGDAATYVANGNYRMFMRVANPFSDIAANPNYSYLQEIVRRPFLVTEYVRLDEFDLRGIDYTRPVYIEKYSSHFAVVSIQRDSDGRCKCELVKLPNINH